MCANTRADLISLIILASHNLFQAFFIEITSIIKIIKQNLCNIKDWPLLLVTNQSGLVSAWSLRDSLDCLFRLNTTHLAQPASSPGGKLIPGIVLSIVQEVKHDARKN